jgi:hypothetical protein
MLAMEAPQEYASDESCLGALRIVAREGWLCKAGWSISKAVHAFAKPTKARLKSRIGGAIVNAVVARHLITALRLQGDWDSMPLLPACLKELELSRFSGTLETLELPPTLMFLSASQWRGAAGVVAVARVLEAAPPALHQLHLIRRHGLHGPIPRRPSEDELAGVQCPAGVTTLKLEGVGWRMKLPSQLWLPQSVRHLDLSFCYIEGSLLLNEGLQRLHMRDAMCPVTLEMPSTLTHLHIMGSSAVDFEVLPVALQHLDLSGIRTQHVLLAPLPETLQYMHVCPGYASS